MSGCSILSVDVEDYYHVEAFTDKIDRSSWDSFETRVERNTLRILDLFDESNVKATFFTLGWVAERHPGLVREIANRGHELACHSYWHRLIYNLTPEQFREDTARAKDVIENACGQRVYGYRAPSYSITEDSTWALDVLRDLGFEYDSSIFPIKHDVYGIASAPRVPFLAPTPAGAIVEYPITTFRLFSNGPNMPVGGGGYLRIFPYWYTTLGIEAARKEGVPLITYIHPWEVDPEQPRLAGRLTSRLRHYTNLAKTAKRLRKLIASTKFVPFRDADLQKDAKVFDLKKSSLGREPQTYTQGAV